MTRSDMTVRINISTPLRAKNTELNPNLSAIYPAKPVANAPMPNVRKNYSP